MIMRLMLVIVALSCSGCWESARQEQTATIRTEERVGIESGQPTQITVTTTERTTTEAQAQAGPDMAKVFTAALAGFKGDILGAMQAMKPAEPPRPSGFDGTTGGLALAAAGLGINALRDYYAKRALTKDRDEGWQKAEAAHAREVELARQLPPKDAANV